MHNPHGGGNTYELERALDEDMLLTSVVLGKRLLQGRSETTPTNGASPGARSPMRRPTAPGTTPRWSAPVGR